MSRLIAHRSFEAVDIRRPFSLFKLAEDRFEGSAPIRRLLTLARQREATFIIIEEVEPTDDIAAENDWLLSRYPDHHSEGLLRLSIWRGETVPTETMEGCDSTSCVGYAVLKHDAVPSRGFDQWHIYEAVLRKFPHPHNYCHAIANFTFRVGGGEWTIPGCLYAQQNGLSKACAQVAIRSVVATRLGRADVSYVEINGYAAEIDSVDDPGNGLSINQIAHVLQRLGVNFFQVNYEVTPELRQQLPFEKLIYSGIESGAGALMVFKMEGPGAPADVSHIIAGFGHTFNEDAWAPQAQSAYFRIGETIRYIPSRAWASSFIVHDDNFGANLCIPTTYLKPDQVGYVVELLPTGATYSGALAEIVSADFFYSILPNLPREENPWLDRLWDHFHQQKLILRCVFTTREQYVKGLESVEDWEGQTEDAAVIEDLRSQQAQNLWMIEVAIPELFSTNKRKLGEILLNAEQGIDFHDPFKSFILARFPSLYVFFDGFGDQNTPLFLTSPSQIQSHTPLFSQDST